MTQGHYNDMLFSLGSYATGSMADFYREISYNKVTITGQVQGAGGPTAGWFRAPRPKSYYANNNFGFGDTGGQFGPTTPKGSVTETSNAGMPEAAFDACKRSHSRHRAMSPSPSRHWSVLWH